MPVLGQHDPQISPSVTPAILKQHPGLAAVMPRGTSPKNATNFSHSSGTLGSAGEGISGNKGIQTIIEPGQCPNLAFRGPSQSSSFPSLSGLKDAFKRPSSKLWRKPEGPPIINWNLIQWESLKISL